MLKENMEILHASAKLLVEREKVTGEEFRELFEEEKRNNVLGITAVDNDNEQQTNTTAINLEKKEQE